MIKKLILLGIFILGLLLPTWAQVGPAAIEFLAFASTGSSIPWQFWPPDPTAQRNFESPILLSFNVPPSPKSQAIFFDIWGQYILTWTSNPIRICSKIVYFKITSQAIPNIEIGQGYGVPPQVSETNNAGNDSYPPDAMIRHKGYTKLPLIRGSLEWWWITDKTGQPVTEELARSYINTMIDTGFKVEVWAGGTIQGLSYIAPYAFQVEVTRLMPRSQQNNQR